MNCYSNRYVLCHRLDGTNKYKQETLSLQPLLFRLISSRLTPNCVILMARQVVHIKGVVICDEMCVCIIVLKGLSVLYCECFVVCLIHS